MQFNLINYTKFNESTTRKQNKNNTKTIHIFNGIFNPTINNEKFQTSYAKLIDSVN